MKRNRVIYKTYPFALLIVKSYKKITTTQNELVLENQLLQIGIFIGRDSYI